MTLQALEKKIHYRFHDQALLSEALTHASCRTKISYERLEFLGDRVLGLAIAQYLFESFPDEPEGDLAKRHAFLVQKETLFELATSINLGDFITLSHAEQETGGRQKEAILADVMESLFGAIYLDSDFAQAQQIIQTLFKSHITMSKTPPQDFKTALQEWSQAHNKPLPIYTLSNQTGPSHAPTFEISLHVDGLPPQKAKATSKRMAEKKAASQMLDAIEKGQK